MAFLDVDKDTCTKCGICAAVCPVGLFTFQKNEYPHPVTDVEKFCIRCGHCVVACPVQSIIHQECPLEQCLPVKKALDISFEQCAQLIKSRRSLRAYQDKPVSREDIARIIDTARYAPSGGNSQGVHWLVFDDKDQMRRFSEIGAEWMRAASKSSPAVAGRLANIIKLQDAGRDGFLRRAPVLILALGDKSNPGAAGNCTLALSYFDLAASSLGLGCCWAGFFMFAAASFPPMIKEISLPEGHHLHGAMTVGYPKYKYQRIPVRKTARITWRP